MTAQWVFKSETYDNCIGRGTTSVRGGIEMAFEDSWAHYCVHHLNQDGLIRG